MRQRNVPFVLFCLALVIIMVLPNLFKDGWFMDGLLYCSVAHNEARDMGTFWYPHFSATSMDFFHEQPPLTFGIMSLFYRVLGDSIYVERFYSFFTLILQTVLIILLWRKVHKDEKELRSMYWVPLILWILIPVCHWCFSNGMEENTMGVFCLLSVYTLWEGLESKKTGITIINIALAGLFAFLASFSKGFPGLFPLVAIFFHWLLFRKFSFARCVIYSLWMTSIVAGCYALILSNEYTRTSWLTYLNARVLNSIKHVSTDGGRFSIWLKLIIDLLIPIGLAGIVLLIARKLKQHFSLTSDAKKRNIFFLLVGISGSLPLIVTLEQRGFYYAHALPYYAISLAGLISPICLEWVKKIDINKKTFRFISILSLLFIPIALLYSAMQYGKFARDKEKIQDIHLIHNIVPQSSIISINDNLCEDWSLRCYLVRLYFISTECSDSRKYYLVEKDKPQPNPATFKQVSLPTTLYNLYERK